METPTLPPKPAIESKTVWGIIIAIVGALLTLLGFDSADELLRFLEDGFQFPRDVWPLLVLIGYALKEIGHRTAKTTVQGIISSDSK